MDITHCIWENYFSFFENLPFWSIGPVCP